MFSCEVKVHGNIGAMFKAREKVLRQRAREAGTIFRDGVRENMLAMGMDGATQRSLKSRLTEVGGELHVEVGGNKNLHWVKFGRGPGGVPPYDAIHKWVQRKSGRTVAQTAAIIAAGKTPMVNKYAEVTEVGFAIQMARVIAAKRGQSGMPVQDFVNAGASLKQARASSRRTIPGRPALPPIGRIQDWIRDKGIKPTPRMRLHLETQAVRYGIAKRGTRRFRLEVDDPVYQGIRRVGHAAMHHVRQA